MTLWADLDFAPRNGPGNGVVPSAEAGSGSLAARALQPSIAKRGATIGEPRVTVLARFKAKEGLEGEAEQAIAACFSPTPSTSPCGNELTDAIYRTCSGFSPTRPAARVAEMVFFAPTARSAVRFGRS